jgi:ribosomal-protein-alanine N-acetyltransferase
MASPHDARLRRLPRGPRVYLRRPAIEDRDEFLALNRASVRLYRGLATPLVTRRAFASVIARAHGTDSVGFFVCRISDDAIVGAVNVSQIVRGAFHSAYMGYQVFAPFARQGYMTEAMPLVLQVVFRRLKLHRVEANIQPGNVPSIALVRRAGFRKEGFSPRYLKIAGRWRDHERWTMLVDDWTQKRSSRSAE